MTLGQMGLRQVVRDVGEAESGQRRIEHLRGAVEDELAFHAHFQFAGALFEFPGVQTATRGQAQIDAVVPDQVLRRSPASVGETLRVVRVSRRTPSRASS
jgi:hypothetical protein